MRLRLGIMASCIRKNEPHGYYNAKMPIDEIGILAFCRIFRNVIHFKMINQFPINCLGNLMKVRFPESRL